MPYIEVKTEYIVPAAPAPTVSEEAAKADADPSGDTADAKRDARKRKRGQNKGRKFNLREQGALCAPLAIGRECPYGDDCRSSHDVSAYLAQKPADLGDTCPIYESHGFCPAGLKCRYLRGHADTLPDGSVRTRAPRDGVEQYTSVIEAPDSAYSNNISREYLFQLRKKTVDLADAEFVGSQLELLNTPPADTAVSAHTLRRIISKEEPMMASRDANREAEASFYEGRLRPCEKRRVKTLNCIAYIQIDWSHRMVLSPLTTVGNVPFRRLCQSFGCDTTYSEMALSLPLLQGGKGEWALPRVHESERSINPISGRRGIFGVQIAGSRTWQTVKAASVLHNVCPSIDFIDLNCGCPIDLVFGQGAGSALLDSPGRLLTSLKGMEAVTGDVPITCKIRMGVRDNKPTALRLLDRVSRETNVSAVALHGRSRQQRYSRRADWAYIRECAEALRRCADEGAGADIRTDPLQLIGNGDVYTWQDWHENVENTGVSTCMVARGALYKPWIFEEIQERRTIDKSSTQRLEMLQQFVDYGLEYWGTDEQGINTTRRFLLEFMSFFHRYIPSGLYDGEAPRASLTDVAPKYRGRDEMETLLASDNAADWVRISERFLGPASETFNFVPKHKSNAIEAEG